jgi:preprotein translocase subunit SecA
MLAKFSNECERERQQVLDQGGLYVIGSERHDSRRIDNQLRGRSGRQGDPGASRFFLSLDDDLMRLFATGALNYVMGRALPDDEAIEAKMVTKAIERAQTTVETKNAEIRKNVLKYDEVMNEQRKIIYQRRDQILDGEDLKNAGAEYLADAVDALITAHCASAADDEWDLDGLAKELTLYWPDSSSVAQLQACADTDEIYEMVMSNATAHYEQREQDMGADTLRQVERQVMLRIIDQRWREHLEEMDYLQGGINLRAMGQKDPLVEWQREGFEMFGTMMTGIAQDFVKYVMHVQVVKDSDTQPGVGAAAAAPVQNLQTSSSDDVQSSGFDRAARADAARSPATAAETPEPKKQETVVKDAFEKTPRNAPCPCGSGKKFKNCHGEA